MAEPLVLFSRPDPRIALLTINRPDKLNALSNAVMAELNDAFEGVEGDPSLGGVIITGAGAKAFVAGADIAELTGATPLEGRERCLRDQRIMRRLETMKKPSIAAMNGYALGGGLELALSCSIRVAADSAKMGFPEAKIGVFPANGGTQRLPAIIGRGRALEMMLTGEPIDAREAWRIGLVNHVVPRDALLDFCTVLMRKMLDNGPLSLAAILQCVAVEPDAGFDLEAAMYAAISSSRDRVEGTKAFLEKRKPVFEGR